jgi:hypothetical protein
LDRGYEGCCHLLIYTRGRVGRAVSWRQWRRLVPVYPFSLRARTFEGVSGVGARGVSGVVVVPDGAASFANPHGPPPRPRVPAPVGGKLLQHPLAGTIAAERGHHEPVFYQPSPGWVEDNRVLFTHGQVTPNQEHLKGEHSHRSHDQHLHVLPFATVVHYQSLVLLYRLYRLSYARMYALLRWGSHALSTY